MEVTSAAVHDRIADLNALAMELRVARLVHAMAQDERARTRRAPRPGARSRLGDWLIGIGTSLGGTPADRRRPVVG